MNLIAIFIAFMVLVIQGDIGIKAKGHQTQDL